MVEITTRLLGSPGTDEALRHVVRHARQTSGADGAAVAMPHDDPTVVRVVVAEGSIAEWQGQVGPVEGSLSATKPHRRRWLARATARRGRW